MVPTNAQMAAIAGVTLTDAIAANIFSITTALSRYGVQFGLDKPHRLVHYLAQICEESGGWKWDKELASGKEYEGRADLGNNEAGDGVRYKGRTAAQLTGRANYQAFTVWCRAKLGTSPDFVENPELLNTDPWEGLVPIWYWSTRKLNALADENNIEQITKKWNGGLNGFSVRVKFWVRGALVILGYTPDAVKQFQSHAGFTGDDLDGDPGPKTRAAMFDALSAMSPHVETQASPVVEKKTVKVNVPQPVPVVAKGSDKRAWFWWPTTGLGGLGIFQSFTDLPPVWKVGVGVGIVALLVILLFLGDRIIRRVKALRDEIAAA